MSDSLQPVEGDANDSLEPVDGEPEGDITEDEAALLELDKVLGEQNMTLLRQLQLIGQAPGQLLTIQCGLETLLDFVFDDGEARTKYELACQMRFNGELKARVAHFAQQLQVPGGNG